jgi:hypothetical protein
MSTLAEAPGQAGPSTASHDIIRLLAKAQNYDWGRTGTESEVRISDRPYIFKSIFNCVAIALKSRRIYCSYSALYIYQIQVAQLQEAAGQSIDPARPYAELW